jgi:hypothetical protein
MATLDKRLRELERQKASLATIEDEDFQILAIGGLTHEHALDELEREPLGRTGHVNN